MKAESEEEREAYDGLQAQLLAAHPAHLPLLLERLQRTQKAAAAAGKGKAEGEAGDDAAGWQVGARVCVRGLFFSGHSIKAFMFVPPLTLSSLHCRPWWLPPREWWVPLTALSWRSTWRKSAPRTRWRCPAPASARRVSERASERAR